MASFTAYGFQHIATLLAILCVSCLLPLGINRFGSSRASRLTAWMLGLALLSVKGAEWIWYAGHGVGWRNLLPLELCDLAAFTSAGALFSRNPRMYELAYFWGLGGTLQALLTPDLVTGFPSAGFWFFFLPHGLVIIAVFFATASLGLRPRPGSIPRVFLVTLAVAAVAAITDWKLGTDYMYLRKKPEAASLFDYLGPWPWYVLSLMPVSLCFLCLWYSPFWLSDRSRGKPKHPIR